MQTAKSLRLNVFLASLGMFLGCSTQGLFLHFTLPVTILNIDHSNHAILGPHTSLLLAERKPLAPHQFIVTLFALLS